MSKKNRKDNAQTNPPSDAGQKNPDTKVQSSEVSVDKTSNVKPQKNDGKKSRPNLRMIIFVIVAILIIACIIIASIIIGLSNDDDESKNEEVQTEQNADDGSNESGSQNETNDDKSEEGSSLVEEVNTSDDQNKDSEETTENNQEESSATSESSEENPSNTENSEETQASAAQVSSTDTNAYGFSASGWETSQANQNYINQNGVWVATNYSNGDITGSEVNVQLGDTLWELAEGAYGNGYLWVNILNANASSVGFLADGSQALIMPGQTLVIPR